MVLLTHWEEFGEGDEALNSPGETFPAVKPRLPKNKNKSITENFPHIKHAERADRTELIIINSIQTSVMCPADSSQAKTF